MDEATVSLLRWTVTPDSHNAKRGCNFRHPPQIKGNMKKWFIKLWRNFNDDCQRCGTRNIAVSSPGMSPFDGDTYGDSYCPVCSTKDEDFLLLYDLLQKGVK